MFRESGGVICACSARRSQIRLGVFINAHIDMIADRKQMAIASYVTVYILCITEYVIENSDLSS